MRGELRLAAERLVTTACCVRFNLTQIQAMLCLIVIIIIASRITAAQDTNYGLADTLCISNFQVKIVQSPEGNNVSHDFITQGNLKIEGVGYMKIGLRCSGCGSMLQRVAIINDRKGNTTSHRVDEVTNCVSVNRSEIIKCKPHTKRDFKCLATSTNQTVITYIQLSCSRTDCKFTLLNDTHRNALCKIQTDNDQTRDSDTYNIKLVLLTLFIIFLPVVAVTIFYYFYKFKGCSICLPKFREQFQENEPNVIVDNSSFAACMLPTPKIPSHYYRNDDGLIYVTLESLKCIKKTEEKYGQKRSYTVEYAEIDFQKTRDLMMSLRNRDEGQVC